MHLINLIMITLAPLAVLAYVPTAQRVAGKCSAKNECEYLEANVNTACKGKAGFYTEGTPPPGNYCWVSGSCIAVVEKRSVRMASIAWVRVPGRGRRPATGDRRKGNSRLVEGIFCEPEQARQQAEAVVDIFTNEPDGQVAIAAIDVPRRYGREIRKVADSRRALRGIS
ncbi:uncharacterized protein L3040_005459 [Drepanopeziza brunnea f. sp. 'multigermtubi']|uniref:uncharacterized protein n=1 Tax=Drepanopeziza brunnea f. sp. 'multigermtubi' TaxID=698441 RepID=UPI00238AF1E7|nr:hypothetical protein L3040_005459 [Drepanopeziza brunnea f. sp. 'multigermtubi']